MRKNHFLRAWLCIMLSMVCMGFVACSDDDDDNGGGGSATLTLGSETVKLNYVYRYYDGKKYQVEFTSYDPVALAKGGGIPSSMNFLSISIPGEASRPPIGEFSGCHLYVARNVSMTSEGSQYEGSATVTVAYGEGGFSISFNDGKVYNDIQELNASLNYTGDVPELPEEYRD